MGCMNSGAYPTQRWPTAHRKHVSRKPALVCAEPFAPAAPRDCDTLSFRFCLHEPSARAQSSWSSLSRLLLPVVGSSSPPASR